MASVRKTGNELLKENLVLYEFLLNQIGVDKDYFENTVSDHLNRLQVTDFIEDSRTDNTAYFNHLYDLGIRIDPEYDRAIIEYVLKIRSKGKEERKKLSLKYFQYLAVLFTEIFLEQYAKDKNEFLFKLNQFLKENKEKFSKIEPFTEENIKRLAYWMATGSGKTILLHINYYQIKKYFKDFNKIILITPNEGLSLQHYHELLKSGIEKEKLALYTGNKESLAEDYEVIVIDINKLRLPNEKASKEDSGKTIYVEEFGNNNILLVDEGHKGKSEEGKWESRRNELCKRGFIFEYSATFGQVVGKSNENINKFGKSIIFDYSYKRFYEDGYGKDFKIFNIPRENEFSQQEKELILTANLLSFYQQLKAFEENKIGALTYNIEKPLWAVLGSKVVKRSSNKSSSKEDKQTLSDVLFFLKFLKSVLENPEYLKERVSLILEGNSGLKDELRRDVFQSHFKYLKNSDLENLIPDIYSKVFFYQGKLNIFEIKKADGELGLKVKDKYFGVINIGDISGLKKNLENELNIKVENDDFSESLFNQAKDQNSGINLIVGARKFIEGWDTWRVSSMGLIYIGRGEGSQIIQLFGRCVRLKGKDFSLKRESEEIREKKPWLNLLQTAYIFGIGSDYLKKFLQTVESEVPQYEEITIKTVLNRKEQWNNKLFITKTIEEEEKEKEILKVEYRPKIASKVKLNLSTKIDYIEGFTKGKTEPNLLNISRFLKEMADILDWKRIVYEITEYKKQKGWWELSIPLPVLKEIINKVDYKIYSNKPLKLNSVDDINYINNLAIRVLKSYLDKYYQSSISQKEKVTIEKLNDRHPNLIDEIKVKIPADVYRSISKELEEIRRKIKESEEIPLILVNTHLYNPIAYEKDKSERIKTVPQKLNKGEIRFVKDLQKFVKNKSLENKVFLLRNLPKIGVGFYREKGYYPDFILWYVDGNTQHIAFVDPKGLREFSGKLFEDNEKLVFNVIRTKLLERILNEQLREERSNQEIRLYGYFVSVTPRTEVNIRARISKKIAPLEEIGILFFDEDFYNGSIFPSTLFHLAESKYIEQIFNRFRKNSNLDEDLRKIVYRAKLNKSYSLEEVFNLFHNIFDREKALDFIVYLRLYSSIKNDFLLDEILINYVNFYFDSDYFEKIKKKKIEEIERLFRKKGILKEEAASIISKLTLLTPIMLNLIITYVQNLLKLGLPLSTIENGIKELLNVFFSRDKDVKGSLERIVHIDVEISENEVVLSDER